MRTDAAVIMVKIMSLQMQAALGALSHAEATAQIYAALNLSPESVAAWRRLADALAPQERA